MFLEKKVLYCRYEQTRNNTTDTTNDINKKVVLMMFLEKFSLYCESNQ